MKTQLNQIRFRQAGASSRYALFAFLSFANLVACGGGVVSLSGGSQVVSSPPPKPAMALTPLVTRVTLVGNKITINEKIQFAQGSAVILPASNGLLDEISDTIKKNSQIKKLEVQGHASSEGNQSANTKLSDDRAKAVMQALVDRKVSKDALLAKGYGSSKMLVTPEKTDDDREKNRRVEFLVLEMGK